MRIAIVGLGVIGASTARSLALAGAQVTVFERSLPAAGTTATSATTFAWINSHQKNPLAYHALNVAGIAEHEALAADGGDWFFQTGNLEWAHESGLDTLSDAVAELRVRGYPAEWITPERARTLVPDLRVPPGVRDIAWYPQEGHVLPAALLARLWGEARDLGAVLRCPEEVTGVTAHGNGARVALASGGDEDFDAVVLAAGRWTEPLAAASGVPVPMADPEAPGSATVGLLGYTAPVPARVGRVLTTPELNVRPEGGGRLVVQGLDLDVHADPANVPAPDSTYAAELCARLGDLVDGAEGARLESLRVGQRSMPADGRTVAGPGSGGHVYVIATHSGITLGPLLGRLAAEEIVSGTQSPLLAEFRPERFEGVNRESLAPLTPARFAGQQ
ncbi:NAD(P)/FAD-dependent oxidoreductase [Streptomyces iconiensis]|uniref:FAD-dependent oxidoreductase n=1 Tax=Streptomyces iconiensis TaxID=1384038 RepID=A0ABT6ZSN2_9ACTN|nr:FAD-dependent oxidoreductase [Streptomyces iconiensis]MDJ1132066.1 FAD-dependent oxidoreductase [Streptomyces iconiensis]